MSTQYSAAYVQANIDTLQSQVTAGQITSITLTDVNTPTLTLTNTQFNNDAGVLNAISGSYNIDVTGVSALNVQIPFLNPHVAAISVADNGLSIGLTLDVLEAYAATGQLTSISLTSGSSLTVTQAQLTNDSHALAKISGNVDFTITAPAAGGAVTGATGHANTVSFAALPSQLTFTGSTDHQTLTVAAGANTYQLSDIQAVQVSGTQVIVAQTPGDASHVNSGNITELYSAVLAREPDLDGLVFYQNSLKSSPSTPLQQFAQYFTASLEYTSSHHYAQTTAGDTLFIQDSYQNLLHRTPAASEVAFYENNVLAPAVAGLTAGTQAYTDAEFQAHAWVLTYFSQSPEFLTNVQVTATNTASAQHWLVLS
jgi:hypothetical protein